MALNAELDNLDGLDAALAAHYVQDAASGKYRLDVAGGFKTSSEIEGLSSALGKERGRADAAEKALKALQGKLAEAEAAGRAGAGQKDGLDAALKARLDPVLKERDEAVKKAQDAEARFQSMLIDKALADSVFIRDRISRDPVHQAYVREHFRNAFRVEDGRVVAYADGQRLYGTDGQPVGVDEALSRMVNALPNAAALLAGSPATGSGASSAPSSGAPSAAMRRAQFDVLSPAEKMKTIKAGVRIVD